MANFYTDNPNLKSHLQHPLMKKIVELKERNFADADKYDYAPSTSRMPWIHTTRCLKWLAKSAAM